MLSMEVKSTEAKWHNARAMALRERFDAATLRLEEAIHARNWDAVDAIAHDMRLMAIEIEYVCRM